MRVLSVLFAAAPFGFALIRAVNSRHDFRPVWMGIASLLGATAVMVVGKARHRTPRGVLALSAVALVVATLLAGWTAMQLGATALAGVWPVSFVVGFCWAASYALNALSRPRPG